MRPDVKAPGLTWNERRDGSWEARWQASSRMVKRGYEIKSRKVWEGIAPTEDEITFIIDRCDSLQNEMKFWARGGATQQAPKVFDGTVESLIVCYQTDKISPYNKKARFATRQHYDRLCRRISKDLGSRRIEELRGRDIQEWHVDVVAGGKISMGHACITMFRTLLGFGAGLLDSKDCASLAVILANQNFENGKPRNSILTADHVVKIRAAAHKAGLHSIALAQALQFECILRQKDVVGEWVPVGERELSDVTYNRQKWLRGLRWEEIDENLILKHVTSKRQKLIEIDLKQAPMVLEEFKRLPELPATGPIVVAEATGRPWNTNKFRVEWRKLARSCGIPDSVRNMDSRAGAITEATDSGAELEHVRHAATHSDIQMTQRYSRNGAEKTANVQRSRNEFRNKNGS